MISLPAVFDDQIREAVRAFWQTRVKQSRDQGRRTRKKDAGERSAVTGGAQMNGFVELFRGLLIGFGVPNSALFAKQKVELPGWFRPEKKWDLLVVRGEKPNVELVACIEFKSHIGPSFGNNYNNRCEEALGSATDLRAAYRQGAFCPAPKPWIGYLMLVEDTDGSTTPVSVRQPHFSVFSEFKDASYIDRYRILMTKLVRDGLYDSACLLASKRSEGATGDYRQVSPELALRSLATSLLARVQSSI